MIPIANYIRHLAKEIPEGDIVMKYRPEPKIKPPRRKSPGQNETSRSDYMKNYMQEYREEGKDYQKVPEKVKEWRREQRKKLEKKKIAIHFTLEAEKWYQSFYPSKEGKRFYEEAKEKYPQNIRQRVEYLFKKFISWVQEREPRFAPKGDWTEYFNEIAHLVKTKIREGLI